jgi:hypothetical protein
MFLAAINVEFGSKVARRELHGLGEGAGCVPTVQLFAVAVLAAVDPFAARKTSSGFSSRRFNVFRQT